MDELIQLYNQLPRSVVWFIGFFVFFFVAIILGDRKLWEYEAKFPWVKGVGRGEIELKCLKKRGAIIEVKMQLDELLRNESIDIEVAGRLIYTLAAKHNKDDRIYHRSPIELEKPNEGDLVSIRINGNPVHSAHLVLD